jgi:hypothetical protein
LCQTIAELRVRLDNSEADHCSGVLECYQQELAEPAIVSLIAVFTALVSIDIEVEESSDI